MRKQLRGLASLFVTGCLAVLLLGALGCSDTSRERKADSRLGPTLAAVALKSFLPQPPSGWEFQQEAQEETIAEAGTRAWAVYHPKAGHSLAKAIQRAEVYLLCRTDIQEGETLDTVFQSGAFRKLLQPSKPLAMSFQVITTNVASAVYLFGGEVNPTVEMERKQLISQFTDKIDQQKLIKAFPPGPAQTAKDQEKTPKEELFASKNHQFAVAFPNKAQETVRGASGTAEFLVRSKPGEIFLVAVSAATIKADDYLNNVPDVLPRGIKGKIVVLRRAEANKQAGIEKVVEGEDGSYCRYRAFNVGPRTYVVLCSGPTKDAVYGEQAQRFFDSFSLVVPGK